MSVSKNPQVFTSKLKVYVLSRRFPGVGCFQRRTHEKKIVQSFLSTAKIITKYSSESFFLSIYGELKSTKGFLKCCKLKLISNLIRGQISVSVKS